MAMKQLDELGMTPDQVRAWENVTLVEQVERARVQSAMNPLASILVTLALDHAARAIAKEVGPNSADLLSALADMMSNVIGGDLGGGMAETLQVLREGEGKMFLQYLTGYEQSHEKDDAGSADRPDAVN